jgi:hypothetical protein
VSIWKHHVQNKHIILVCFENMKDHLWMSQLSPMGVAQPRSSPSSELLPWVDWVLLRCRGFTFTPEARVFLSPSPLVLHNTKIQGLLCVPMARIEEAQGQEVGVDPSLPIFPPLSSKGAHPH